MPNHVTTRCIVTGPSAEVARFKERMIVVKMEERREHWPADRELKECVEFDFDGIIPMPGSLKGSVADSQADLGSQLILIANANQFSDFGSGAGLHAHERKAISAVGENGLSFPDRAREYLRLNPEVARAGAAALRAAAETGYTNWYEWSVDNWGTKWGAYEFTLIGEAADDDDRTRLEFTFQTAWSFPEMIFRALLAEWPQLDFDCATFDEGSNFAGAGHFAAGTSDPFVIGEATDELYERVYGHAPEREEEDEEA